jgi:hypothetical protein
MRHQQMSRECCGVRCRNTAFTSSQKKNAVLKKQKQQPRCQSRGKSSNTRFRAKREQFKTFKFFLSESPGQNLALTVLYVSYSVDRGTLKLAVLPAGAQSIFITLGEYASSREDSSRSTQWKNQIKWKNQIEGRTLPE